MLELTQRELLERTALSEEAGDSFAVFMYTPFCGTCKLAERMLHVIETMQPELPLFKSNINYLPQAAAAWQIRSVPCVAIICSGTPDTFIYSMQSVDELYARLTAGLAT